jgi:hypothetical protein
MPKSILERVVGSNSCPARLHPVTLYGALIANLRGVIWPFGGMICPKNDDQLRK